MTFQRVSVSDISEWWQSSDEIFCDENKKKIKKNPKNKKLFLGNHFVKKKLNSGQYCDKNL